MRTHSITLDDESSHTAKELGNFSQFVRKALAAHKEGTLEQPKSDRQVFAMALHRLQNFTQSIDGFPSSEMEQKVGEAIDALMYILMN